MKKFLVFTLIQVCFSINSFAQCEGSESRIIDGLIETFEKIEKHKRKETETKDKKTQNDVSVGGFTISGLTRSEGYINLDALLDWNVGFSEGLAKITINGKSGFINRDGQIVIKPQYKLASCFSNGLAAVKIGKKWGYIDADNKLVIAAKFDAADNFSEGLALVKVGELWGFINPLGKFAISPRYENADSFSEGLAAVGFYDKEYVWTTHSRENGKWVGNFINKNGKFAFVNNFDGVYEKFDGGMALVGRNIGYKNDVISETYVIGKNGEQLWKLNSWYITRFSNDLIVVAVSQDEATKRNKYSFLDRNGKRVTDNVYDNLDSFSEGLAVATKDGKDGL
ncbi:MAG: WG repeat-containing protein [Acidobacteria bacterium]|nr:WG repeat-containing protein [Acidobacteriota bacterium]